MQEKSSNKMDEKLIDKIITVAYGDAVLYDRMVVWINAKRDPEIYKLLNEYKLTDNSVHQLKETEMPSSLLSSFREKIGKKSEREYAGSFIYSFASKPLLSASVTGLIIIAIVSVLLLNQPQQKRSYTKAEIELAQKQLEESIAIVNKVFLKAENQFDKEVLPKHVSKQLNKGFYLINEILIGG